MYVGYLGPSGSFTHNAALKAFPEAELVSLGTITEVIKSYEEGRVDYAVIPVENSIEGSVHESLDYLFHQADIRAVAEIVQPIKQQLMATKHMRRLKKIFSHPTGPLPKGKKYIKQAFFHMPRLRQQQVQPLRLVLSLIIQISLMRQSLLTQLLRNTVYKYWLRISKRLKRIIPVFGCWGTLFLRFRSIRLIVN